MWLRRAGYTHFAGREKHRNKMLTFPSIAEDKKLELGSLLGRLETRGWSLLTGLAGRGCLWFSGPPTWQKMNDRE